MGMSLSTPWGQTCHAYAWTHTAHSTHQPRHTQRRPHPDLGSHKGAHKLHCKSRGGSSAPWLCLSPTPPLPPMATTAPSQAPSGSTEWGTDPAARQRQIFEPPGLIQQENNAAAARSSIRRDTAAEAASSCGLRTTSSPGLEQLQMQLNVVAKT